MKAAVWLGPRDIQMQEAPVPDVKDDEVLIKVAAVGICGSELSGYLGQNSLRVPPLIMGHEFTGTIVEVGAGVSQFAPGMRVTVNPMVPDRTCVMCRNGFENLCLGRCLVGAHRPGAFAEYVAVPAIACYRLPDEIDDVTGTLVEPIACAVRAVELAGVGLGSSVLIEGAGPIGLLSVRLAKMAGASLIGVSDVVGERLDVAREWGATHTWNPIETDLQQAVPAACDGLGADAVIDAVGLPVTREAAVRVVRPGGQVVFIGLHEDMSVIPGNLVVRSEVAIKGSFCYTQRDFQAALRLVRDGVAPPVDGWATLRALDETNASFAQLIDQPSSATKIILRP